MPSLPEAQSLNHLVILSFLIHDSDCTLTQKLTIVHVSLHEQEAYLALLLSSQTQRSFYPSAIVHAIVS